MPTRISDIAALLTRRANDDLLTLLQNTPEERLSWKAIDTTRTVIELVQECATVNQKWAFLITERGCTVGSAENPQLIAFLDALQDTREDCVRALQQSTTALIQAIHTVSDNDTYQWINRSRVKTQLLTLAEAVLYPYWHMVYHEGQINLLQLFWGDEDDHHDYHLADQPLALPIQE